MLLEFPSDSLHRLSSARRLCWPCPGGAAVSTAPMGVPRQGQRVPQLPWVSRVGMVRAMAPRVSHPPLQAQEPDVSLCSQLHRTCKEDTAETPMAWLEVTLWVSQSL